LVDVYEFTAKGKEEGKQGFGYDSKNKKAVIVVELNQIHKIKNIFFLNRLPFFTV